MVEGYKLSEQFDIFTNNLELRKRKLDHNVWKTVKHVGLGKSVV